MTVNTSVPILASTPRPDRLAVVVFVALLGVGHMIIDGACNFAMAQVMQNSAMSDETARWVVISYNLLAFATQWALGWTADRAQLYRMTAVAGGIMTLAGTLVYAVAPQVALVLCGLGNALFHVGAGALVLNLAGGWALLAGIFVGPGDLGVLFGTNVGREVWALGAWPFVLGCWLVLVPLLLTRMGAAPQPTAEKSRPLGRWFYLVLALLLFALALRSVMTSWLGSWGAASANWFIYAYVVACAAKMAGGWLADRLGWTVLAVGASVAALVIMALGPQSWWLTVAGVVLVQLPMGVTLAATSRLFPQRPAFAFGLATLFIYLGGLPMAELPIAPDSRWVGCGLQAGCALALLVAVRMTQTPRMGAGAAGITGKCP